MIRLLVTGGRTYANKTKVHNVLSHIHARTPIGVVIHGLAKGADMLADEWAIAHHIHVARVPALWGSYPIYAGPKRNEILRLLQPQMCVAFPGGRGTADMVSKCRDAQIPVYKVEE